MAVDTALLEAAQRGHGYLRLYGWDPPCLSFGRNEPAARRYDRHRIETMRLDVVRRPTGGRAVWHEHEVTYAVAAPQAAFGSLRDAYVAIHHVIADGLRSLGIDARLAGTSRVPGRGAGSCFATPIGGEITVGGRKLVGSAQYRHGTALLQHGSILLDNRQDVVAGLLLEPTAPPDAIAISDLGDDPPSCSRVAETLAAAARAAWSGSWDVRDLAIPVDTDRYRDPAWTWRR